MRSTRTSSRACTFSKGFTLIELLAALTVTSILLAVGVPLFTDPSNNARKASRDILRAHLQQARAHAIATGNTTAVLLPDYADADTGGKLSGIAEITLPTNRTGSYQVSKLLQRWTRLPQNIYFLNQAA